MNQSSSLTASTLVKAAALAMAVPALLLPMKAAAQQMALGGPTMADCDKLTATAPAKAAQCRVDVLKAQGVAADARGAAADARGAAADVRLAALNAVAPCLEYLKAQKAAGKPMVRPVTKENICAVAQEMGMSPR